MNTDYLCEQKLKREDPALHSLFRDCVACLQQTLLQYKNVFPSFTDHTALHSIEVIDFCNKIIDTNIDALNTDEIYVLLMAAYLHDTGMGVTMSDYEQMKERIDFGNYFDTHASDDIPEIIRSFHHEFSGEYIKKYADFFEIPSPEHLFAIVQVSRGHRKTDLYDEIEYPADYRVPNGNKICLPYLAALIRLADELDIAADRNLQFMYDLSKVHAKRDIIEFKKHLAIKHLDITEKEFVMTVDSSDQEIYEAVLQLKDKLFLTFSECRDVVETRTPYHITQERIRIVPLGSEESKL